MTSTDLIGIPILGLGGASQGQALISLTPRAKINDATQPLLVVDRSTDGSTLEVQLLEGAEYRYEISLPSMSGRISTDKPDILDPDTTEGCRGRLRPGLHTGGLPIRVFCDEREVGSFQLEVRSRKLAYKSHYRWMLRDLADQMSELVMMRFAATEQRFAIDDTRDAATLYQRFAFLRSLLSGSDFEASLRHILTRPYVAWIEEAETSAPGRGLRGSSSLAKQLARSSSRSPWPGGPLPTIPTKLQRHRTEVSLDNLPNRFVKHALNRWRQVVAQIGDALAEQASNYPVDRGRREVAETLDQIDALLAEKLFRGIGDLHYFPAANQVLQKREGYRHVYRAYILFEVASKLSWSGGDSVYGAGQRDVATLYEYWVFLQLGQIVSSICQTPFDFANLLEVAKDHLNVALQRGKQCVLEGTATRLGRDISVQLWFNRSFAPNIDSGSWTLPMRPDCSLRLAPAQDEEARFEDVWLHFDAKYRIDTIGEVLGDLLDGEEAAPESVQSEAKRDDLLKMHAYRDAIRRTAGAYVLYPGTENEVRREYHEVLPGLGAFALQPSESGRAIGSFEVARFIDDVLLHVATQASAHERSRYWEGQIFRDRRGVDAPEIEAVDFLVRPPADTKVLIGYVHSKEHWDWVYRTGRYNLRADNARRGAVGLSARELGCELVLLSSPALQRIAVAKIVGEAELTDSAAMLETGYPNPRGNYFCLGIHPLTAPSWFVAVSTRLVEDIRKERTSVHGAPITVRWADLLTRVSGEES